LSSASILVLIRQKEQEIRDCEAEISRLKERYRNQDEACAKYEEMAAEFDFALDQKQKKIDMLRGLESTSTLASKYVAYADTTFNSSSTNGHKSKMGEISTSISGERSDTDQAKTQQESKLIRLKQELAQLKAGYQSALAQEQRQREQAAKKANSK
jgi:chromosome segregation ATPase